MEKISWWGNIENNLQLQVIIFFHQAALFKDIWKTQILDFMNLKRMIQLWPLQIYFKTLSISIHLKIKMEEFVA